VISRLVCAAGLVLLAGACSQSTAGSPVVPEPSGDSIIETTPSEPPPSDEYPTETSRPTSTTTRTSSARVSVTTPKTITTPPSCAAMITKAEIGRLTDTTATQEPEDKGYCSYTLTRSGQPAGIALVVLNQTLEAPNSQTTTFEGNTAHRSLQQTACDLRVALSDDESAEFRVLWVSVVLTNPGGSVCETTDKLAKAVFDKLPGS
jgi:hypothetical protein